MATIKRDGCWPLWVAEALGQEEQPRILRTPSELLLADDLLEQVIICDGCRGGLPVGTLRLAALARLANRRRPFLGQPRSWIGQRAGNARSIGTTCRSRVWLWTIEIAAAVPGMEISPAVLASLAPETIGQFIRAGTRRAVIKFGTYLIRCAAGSIGREHEFGPDHAGGGILPQREAQGE